MLANLTLNNDLPLALSYLLAITDVSTAGVLPVFSIFSPLVFIFFIKVLMQVYIASTTHLRLLQTFISYDLINLERFFLRRMFRL